MIKIAILGNGILGAELSNQKNCFSFSRKEGNLNINNLESITKIIKNHEVIINCIANTNSYSNDFQSHWDVNYIFPKNLVKLTNQYKKKLVHISTEFVYANNPGSPVEEDEPIPNLTYYSMSKLLADNYIKYNSDNYLICRSLHKAKNLCYDYVWDINTKGDTVDIISKIILKLVNKGAQGIFNVGTDYKHLSKIIKGKKIIDAPIDVPKSININISKLKQFLNESN